MEPTNCNPGRPLIDLGEGDAPTLDYNVPQKSCFSALGRIRMPIPEEWFLDKWRDEPERHFWKLPLDDINKAKLLLERDGLLIGPAAGLLNARGGMTELPTRRQARRSVRTGREATSRNVSATAVSPDNAQLELAAELMTEGFRPIERPSLSGVKKLRFIPKPDKPLPRLYLVEEYRVCSYLADYGAGKTLNTFSLLPGEKTKISIRTYRDSEQSRSSSANILDSFTEESADELEELVETEGGWTFGSSSSHSSTSSGDVGLGVGIDLFGIVSADVGGGYESSGTKSSETHQEENFDVLERSLSKHVEQTSHTREVEINSTTSESVSEGEEQAIVRELSNINHSRVLNFVFRQLLQEYVSIFYLNNVRVAFSNGYPESIEAVELYSIDEVLPKYIKPEHINDAKEKLLEPYCTVFNYKQQAKEFIERVELNYGGCVRQGGRGKKRTFFRKHSKLKDSFEGIEVHGVIKRVQRNVLRTPAVVIEALLGQGEALDCYNQELQSATVDRVHLDNAVKRQGLDLVNTTPEAADKVDAHVRIFNPPPVEEDDKEDGQ